MPELIKDLSTYLKKNLAQADEIWVATALLNREGQAFIEKSAGKLCIQHYLIGIDLPSHPDAIRKLWNQRITGKVAIKIYGDKPDYHPKVYIIRKGNSYTAVVGSANCTGGGLFKNIELGVTLNNARDCRGLIEWFNELYDSSQHIDEPFLRRYKKDFKRRMARKKADRKEVQAEKKALVMGDAILMEERTAFLKTLIRLKKSTNYQTIRRERMHILQTIRDTLDYPRFDKIDVDAFFSIWHLGHLIAIPKPTILRRIDTFRKLLRMLCDDSRPASERISRAFRAPYKIRGVGMALVTKVLCIHDPSNYHIDNDKSRTALELYGIQVPRGVGASRRYEGTAHFLKQICSLTNIANLAVLDYYLYQIASEQAVTPR